MKRMALIGMCAAVAALGLMGCEWDSTSGTDNWSSSYDWVNFSGVYRGTSGGLVVTEPGDSTASGTTRYGVYSLNVSHQGQHLSFTDSNGATYTGRIKKMESASGFSNTDIPQVGGDEEGNDERAAKYTYQESPLPANGDLILASFECTGYSRAGLSVRLIGTLQGTVGTSSAMQGAVDEESSGVVGVFTGRQIQGTWIERGGRTGDVSAQAEAVSIPEVTTPPATTTPVGGIIVL